jgi:hypothetical protein
VTKKTFSEQIDEWAKEPLLSYATLGRLVAVVMGIWIFLALCWAGGYTLQRAVEAPRCQDSGATP